MCTEKCKHYHHKHTSAGQFTSILIYQGVFIAPVQRFHHNSTGYDRILKEFIYPVYEIKNVVAKHAWQGSLTN